MYMCIINRFPGGRLFTLPTTSITLTVEPHAEECGVFSQLLQYISTCIAYNNSATALGNDIHVQVRESLP